MVINYFGKQFFRIILGDLSVALNPISKESKLKKISRFGANLALISVNHPDYNGVDTVTHGAKPFIISGPGDYEVREIFIRGLSSKARASGKELINTIYTFNLDGINICFFGALTGDIKNEIREAIGAPDILFVPIGGVDVLSAKEAYKLAISLEPKIIIPMDYGEDREKDALKIFLKEGGEKVEPIDKLTLKKKDLEGREGEIIVFKTAV